MIHKDVSYTSPQKEFLKKYSEITCEVFNEPIHYSCDYCANKSIQQDILKNHMKSTPERICYPCDHCIYEAITKDHLKSHDEKVHKAICYSCNQCKYICSRKERLKQHMVVTHEVYIDYDQVLDLNEEIKPHCNICDKESVKEEYNKPLPIDEPFLPIEENNGKIQNNKILLSDNDTSDNIKY